MLRIILVLLLVAGGAVLIGVNQVWHTVTVQRDEPLPPLGLSATGSDLLPLGLGVGVLLLASVVAVAATRGLGRRIVAVVILVAVIWLAVLATQLLAGDLDAAVTDSGTQVDPSDLTDAGLLGPALVYAGCVAGLGAAALLWVWARRLPRMGERYERTDSRRRGNEVTEQRDRWRALDRGEDPTL